jgi:hypothetical protein
MSSLGLPIIVIVLSGITTLVIGTTAGGLALSNVGETSMDTLVPFAPVCPLLKIRQNRFMVDSDSFSWFTFVNQVTERQ